MAAKKVRETREISVEVTEDDIAQAYLLLKRPTYPRCQACPVALALGRTLGLGLGDVMVGAFTVDAYQGRHKMYGDLPEPAREFINTFDRHGTRAAAPMTFTITMEVR